MGGRPDISSEQFIKCRRPAGAAVTAAPGVGAGAADGARGQRRGRGRGGRAGRAGGGLGQQVKIHLSQQLQLGFQHRSLISESNEAFCSAAGKARGAPWSPSLFQQEKMANFSFRPFFKQTKNGYAKGSVLSYYAFGERTQNDESKRVFFLCSAPNNISNLIKAAPAFSFSGIETHIAAPTINFHCLQLRTLPRYVP